MSLKSSSFVSRTVVFCCLAIIIRLITLGSPDLVDTTEGRYAGVAQIMLERNDWVTPWIHYRGSDQPYLGKPPLHFWLMETSYLVFGQNNFAARLPGVVSAAGIAALLIVASSILFGSESALVALAIFTSSCMVFFLSGSVILDVTLTFGITASLVGFLLADRKKIFGYLFFIGMALGVLVKGPLSCVLTLGIIAPWALLIRYDVGKWPSQLSHLPWRLGIPLFLAIVIPWYWMAEIRNPGFLKYFLWNENFGRYLKNDYGDVYGSGHRQPFGAAWGMMILALFPWSFFAIALLWLSRRKWLTKGLIRDLLGDQTMLFALGWTFCCPVLLLGARQYTGTYLFPSLPGFAFLAAALWNRQKASSWIAESTLTSGLRFTGTATATIGALVTLASVRYNAPLGTACAGTVACVLAALYVRTSKATLSALANTGFASLVVFGVLTYTYDNYISENRSSRRVLERANSLIEADKPLRIGFAHYFPFSARFYAPLLGRKTFEVINLEQRPANDSEIDLLILRQRSLKAVMAEHPQAQEIAQVGQWRVLRPQ